VLFTTPDMLHAGILPGHATWRPFLANLRLIVLDEVHTYRGVLGGHMAQVLRRLLRIAHHYGADPRIVACSATIGNPEPFSAELLGRPAVCVAGDGAPRPARHLAFVEPEVSPYTAAARLFRLCVAEGLRTIAFTQARRATELMHTWILEAAPELAPRISSYRSGFLPEERRDIERRLFSGELAGVISTSALELGIDVGGLDACILVGYPGSILATRQRSGRVGRAREGLVFIVPQRDALDRFFLEHPRALIDRPCEDAVLDRTNPEIVAAHLPCAAAELPLRSDEAWLQEPRLDAGLARCLREGSLLESAAGGEWFSARRNPAREVSIREIGESYAIRRRSDGGEAASKRGRSIGTIGASRVYAECHPGAIYLHRARSWAVQQLDLERREVLVAGPVRVDHYTRALGDKETEILEITASRPLGNALLRLGRLRITSRITHYEKRRIFGQDLLGSHPLDLPPTRFETEGAWLELAPEIEAALQADGRHFMGGIHGLEHAALALFPLFALCDRFDVAGISIPRHPQVRGPAIFLYDGVPGGLGITRSLLPRMEELLEATGQIVASCDCEDGCPSCVHSPRCGSGNRPLDKAATARTVDLILGREELPQLARPREPLPAAPLEARPAAAPLAPVVLDVETQRSAEEVGGWHNAHLMRLALAVLYDSASDNFDTFFEDDVDALLERLFSAPLVVGFNIVRFDYRVLGAYSHRALQELPTFDLLQDLHTRIGHRIALGHLAECTLGREKGGDGLQSLAWFREGKLDLIEDYCRQDVALTRDLLEFGQREGHVLYRHRSGELVKVHVDWDLGAMLEQAEARRPAAARG
jgi:DEAD/DEAH box helicase domain-containing protein